MYRLIEENQKAIGGSTKLINSFGILMSFYAFGKYYSLL